MKQPTLMAEADLDTAYTELCHTLTRLGEPLAPLFLARFALLAISRLADPVVVRQMVAEAAADMTMDVDVDATATPLAPH